MTSIVFPLDNIQTQLILITRRFHICKFPYKLKFICNLKVSTGGTFLIIYGYSQNSEKFESRNTLLPNRGCKR